MGNTMMRSIAIGHEFFQKAKNDYSDWRWAVAREFMQNCLDAPGCDAVNVTVTFDEAQAQTTLTVTNNGDPMDLTTLVDKLLCLGASGKGFQGTVGGFGKAKEVLYLAHRSYTIRTGTLLVSGSGANYELTEGLENFHGTTSTVVMDNDERESLTKAFNRFALLAQWGGTLTMNGERRETSLRKGSRRKDFTWGTVYTNQSIPGTLLCRMGGIPMFLKGARYDKGMVLIELTGTSADVLTANRDGLRYTQQAELDDFLSEIAVNTRSAFKDKARKPKKTRYAGYKLVGHYDDEEVELGQALQTKTPQLVQAALVQGIAQATVRVSDAEAPSLTVADVEKVFRPEFFLKSEIEGTIPAWFTPGGFSANSKRLISNWIGLLVEIASIAKLDKAFSVGFVFDPDCVAQYERENGEHVVYVNPAKMTTDASGKRRLKAAWKFDAAGNYELLATALHEFCHLEGHVQHDEDYAARLTDLFAIALTNRKRLSRHFQAAVAWPD
jgi:hypothetical protein